MSDADPGKESGKLSDEEWKAVFREVVRSIRDGTIKPEPPEGNPESWRYENPAVKPAEPPNEEASRLTPEEWNELVREVRKLVADGTIKGEPPIGYKKLDTNPYFERLFGPACLSERQSRDAVTELSNTLCLLRILTIPFESNS